MSEDKKASTGDWLKRKINVARAASGLSWSDIEHRLLSSGVALTANSLRQKHSRCSFSAVELISVLQVLGVEVLDVRESAPGSRRRGGTRV